MTIVARRCGIDIAIDISMMTVGIALGMFVTGDAREILIRAGIGVALCALCPSAAMAA